MIEEVMKYGEAELAYKEKKKLAKNPVLFNVI